MIMQKCMRYGGIYNMRVAKLILLSASLFICTGIGLIGYHKTFVSGYENDIIEYDFTEQSNQILDNYIAT